MKFGFIFGLSVVLTIILFSSGLRIFSSSHLGLIKDLRKRGKVVRWIADVLLYIIVTTARMRRAWIRMISPGSDSDLP
jgi:hypothetical protein